MPTNDHALTITLTNDGIEYAIECPHPADFPEGADIPTCRAWDLHGGGGPSPACDGKELLAELGEEALVPTGGDVTLACIPVRVELDGGASVIRAEQPPDAPIPADAAARLAALVRRHGWQSVDTTLTETPAGNGVLTDVARDTLRLLLAAATDVDAEDVRTEIHRLLDMLGAKVGTARTPRDLGEPIPAAELAIDPTRKPVCVACGSPLRPTAPQTASVDARLPGS